MRDEGRGFGRKEEEKKEYCEDAIRGVIRAKRRGGGVDFAIVNHQ